MTPAPGSRGFDLFRIAGIQISIDPSWIIIFLLVSVSAAKGIFPAEVPDRLPVAYWVAGAIFGLLFFASVLFHELAHSIVANRLGEEVKKITLFLFGGMAHLTREPNSWKSEIKIAAVGPLASFFLAALFFGCGQMAYIAWGLGLLSVLFAQLAIVNLALGIFNLLPGLPLDGGRIARGLFWRHSGSQIAATRRAAKWGATIGIAMMVWGGLRFFQRDIFGGIWLIFIGMFLRGAAMTSLRSLMMSKAIEGQKVSDLMVREPVTVPHHATLREALQEYFVRYQHRSFPVVFGDEPLGVLRLETLRKAMAQGDSEQPVSAIIHRIDPSMTIGPGQSVQEMLRRSQATGLQELFVMSEGRLVGWITPSTVQRFVEFRLELLGDDSGPRSGGRSASDLRSARTAEE
ncbi:MAG: site-2 protease family protein [Planctomycetota bacterium]